MNLFKLIKAYWRGFVGGPDLHHSITRRFLLEDKQLSINIPDSNIVALPNADDKYYPHTSLTWFNEHAKVYDQHKYVHVYTKNWMYMPPIALFPSSEYGMLSCQLRIKQLNHINVLDKVALSHYVTQAYIDYHYGPDGTNTELRRRKVERSSQRASPWTPEELEEQVAISIDLQGRQPLAPAIIKSFNQTDWIFYSEVRNNSHSHNDFYCLPLSENSFLEVEFAHRVDLSHKYKKWAKHALESQERIIASVYLDELPQEQSIEHSVN
ncbi:hypothetical protein L3081_00610 [Colwellia sp. MSW7]|uniref:Uncharacterized protein n=1 Tax=Colwellia maritima TaxID=2912588 RepID=A0ABS9WWE5_9GAMM|nr:hypothetical protein [Colwellia maritima]MCI2282171.1 hypothetical protein [Colwellia maritima]